VRKITLVGRARNTPVEETPAFAHVAEGCRRSGDLTRAVSLCQDGLRRFPDHVSGRVTLGWALLDLGRFDEARQELQHALKRAPDNLAAIRGLAHLHEHTDGGEFHDESHQTDHEHEPAWFERTASSEALHAFAAEDAASRHVDAPTALEAKPTAEPDTSPSTTHDPLAAFADVAGQEASEDELLRVEALEALEVMSNGSADASTRSPFAGQDTSAYRSSHHPIADDDLIEYSAVEPVGVQTVAAAIPDVLFDASIPGLPRFDTPDELVDAAFAAGRDDIEPSGAKETAGTIDVSSLITAPEYVEGPDIDLSADVGTDVQIVPATGDRTLLLQAALQRFLSQIQARRATVA
jgi:hypothetical protein